jgi:hypothetical protein
VFSGLVSCAPETVTVCAVFQLSWSKVSVLAEVVTSAVPMMDSEIVTVSPTAGCLVSTTV